MKQPRVLLLEDELQLAKIVSETLTKRDFNVTHVVNGVLGLDALRKGAFDICVIDVMMPFMDGFSFAEEVRKTDKSIPLLFLTAKSQTDDLIRGYAAGGNDYLKKPFSLEELLLRLNELLNRKAITQPPASISIGKYTFMPNKQELWFDDQLFCKLSHRENELLTLLVQQRNQVLDRKAVLLKIWGDDNFFNTRTMDVFVTKLRKHLRKDPSIEIINIRGLGYKLIV
jgi:DNA-binding response OmpR family regulator